MTTTTELLRSNGFSVIDHRCSLGKGSCTCTTAEDQSHITMMRRGCFVAKVAKWDWLVAPGSTFLYHAGTEFRTEHPVDGGDDCTIVTLEPYLLDEIFGRAMVGRGVCEMREPYDALIRHASIFRQLTSTHQDRVATEETVLQLLEALREPGGSARDRRGPASANTRRKIVLSAREQIHADLSANLSIADLAKTCGISAFHLMRLFRHETGMAVREYRLSARIAEAVHQITADQRPLTEIAYACGFSSHSHMADAVRRRTGMSPTAFRMAIGT